MKINTKQIIKYNKTCSDNILTGHHDRTNTKQSQRLITSTKQCDDGRGGQGHVEGGAPYHIISVNLYLPVSVLPLVLFLPSYKLIHGAGYSHSIATEH